MIDDKKLRITSAVLAVIGLIDSAYLTWSKLTHTPVICGGSSKCQTVNDSQYAEIGGIPISLLGMGAYLVILGLLYLENRGDFWTENSKLIFFGITLIGVLYSAYLTYIEVAIIYAICPYCVVSAVVMLFLFIIAIVRLVQDT